MKESFLKVLVALISALLAVPAAVLAAVPGGATVTSSTTHNQYYIPPSTINVYAGNITEANITTEQSTYHWAGIYGNASGYLVLGDSSGYKMYRWVAKAKYVYFDNESVINWGSLNATDCGTIDALYPFLSGASDDCAYTFTTTASFYSPATGDNVASTIAAQTYDGTGTPYWYTIALNDTVAKNVVFVGEVSTGTAYNGATFANYQVILPEDGSNGDTTPTPYYVWIELY